MSEPKPVAWMVRYDVDDPYEDCQVILHATIAHQLERWLEAHRRKGRNAIPLYPGPFRVEWGRAYALFIKDVGTPEGATHRRRVSEWGALQGEVR